MHASLWTIDEEFSALLESRRAAFEDSPPDTPLPTLSEYAHSMIAMGIREEQLRRRCREQADKRAKREEPKIDVCPINP